MSERAHITRKSFRLDQLTIDPVALGIAGNAVLGIKESGKTYTATKLAEELFDHGIPFIAFDPIGVWRFLRYPGKGIGYPVVVAGGSDGDLPLTVAGAPEIVRAAMQNGISLVIDLYDLHLTKADWRRIVTSCVRLLLYENKAHGMRHVFIEEAHEFVPQMVRDGVTYAEVEKLATMGGNSGLGYTLISQRAEGVNKAVLELCDNLFLHRQKGKNSLLSLGKWFDVADVDGRDIVKSLPRLPQGECWAWMAGSDQPVHIKVPAKHSLHPDRRLLHGDSASYDNVEGVSPIDIEEFVIRMQMALSMTATPKSSQTTLVPPKKLRDLAHPESSQIDFEPPRMLEGEVTKEEAAQLRAENADLRQRLETVSKELADLKRALRGGSDVPAQTGIPDTPVTGFEFGPKTLDVIWAAIKERATQDKDVLLALTRMQPELMVTVKKHRVEADSSSAVGLTARLIADGYFDEAKTANAAWNEIKRYGFKGLAQRIYEACDKLTDMGFLTSEGKGVGYRAVKGMKINVIEEAA